MGETNITKLIKGMSPVLNSGEYVFATVKNLDAIDRHSTICEFKEREGTTVVISKEKADQAELAYDYIASWITLSIHSSLDAVGLTAKFSSALSNHGISCNVIAGYYHDHIFVGTKDAKLAMQVLSALADEF